MYQAFMSHNSSDKLAVEELARRLEREGISCFLDKWHLVPGEPWQPALEQALDDSETCIVFVGPAGLGPWQNEEMRAAISRRVTDRSRTFRVVPVLLPGAIRDQRSRLPTFLVAATWVEFGESLDDAAYHRLKCGITGVPPGISHGEAVYSGERPYRGLEFFDSEHAKFFFGREAQVDWMIEHLADKFGTPRENRFLGVVGASGSGKSSLVRAGLVTSLRDGRSRNGKSIPDSAEWPVVVFRPGAEPLKSLADALSNNDLAQPFVGDTLKYADQLKMDERRLHATIGTALHRSKESHRFVVVVDQFEEIFTLRPGDSDSESLAFINNLMYACSLIGGKTVVVVTMRADFYGKCAAHPELARSLSDSHELVSPLSDDDVRRAIEGPAQLVGCVFQNGLVDMLVKDVRDQPGALPLLQYTLTQMWEHRQGPSLTLETYKEIGELSGSLEHRANNVFESLTAREQDICRRLFLRLTRPGLGTDDTKRRVPRKELDDDSVTDTVIRKLADARLVFTEGKTQDREDVFIEVAHEAIIHGWPLLRSWLC